MTTYSVTIGPSDLPDGNYTAEVVATDASPAHNVTDTTPIDFAVSAPSVPNVSPPGRPDLQVLIAFGQAPFTPNPVWTDVTADVLFSSGVTIVRGATANNPQPTPGTINFTLIDKERKYDPENAASPYAGTLTYGCPCQVQGAFAKFSTPVDLHAAVNTHTPVAGTNENTVPLGYGYIDGFPQTYSDPADNYVTIPVTAPDGLSVLARTSFVPALPFTWAPDTPDGAAVDTHNAVDRHIAVDTSSIIADYMRWDSGAVWGDPIPQLDQERSGTRIFNRLLIAGIDSTFLDIDEGATLVEAELPTESNILDHIRKITATEYGRFYQAADGTLRFVQRQTPLKNMNVSNATFAEIPPPSGHAIVDPASAGIPYAALQLDPADRRFLVNRAIRSSASVPQILVQDDDSITKFGTFEDSQTLAFSDIEDATNQATYIVARFSGAPARITSLTVKPDHPGLVDVMFPVVTQAEIGNVYTVSRTPLGQGDPIVKYVTAEQITHTFDTKTWTMTLDLGEADTTQYFQWDVSNWDSGDRWAY